MNKQRKNDALVGQVSERLRQMRKERRLSQDDVLFDTDIHIARIETGSRNISISTLADLCDYYGVTLEKFFKGIETK